MMWKLYSRNYLRENQTVSLSIGVTILISSFFLSFLLCLFYNLWLDERARAALEKRAWQPNVLTGIYGMVLLLACLTLLSMMYHAFELTKEGRLHQLGILQSVGATPGQIYLVLLEEAFVLGIPAMAPGMLAGAGSVWLIARAARHVNRMTGKMEMVFHYSRTLFLFTAGICVLTLFLAANRSARRLSRMTALEALRGREHGEETQSGRVRRFWPGFHLPGVEWELAERSLYARRRAFRTAALSLTLACTAFSLYLNFWAMSAASRQHTYFERYKAAWSAEQYAAELAYERMMELGYTAFVGGLCGLLACIGLTNVFANTLGSVNVRKREFARYQSLGFTEKSMWKILAAEGCLTALRPVLFCLPLNVCFVIWGVSYAPITWEDYWKVIPVGPFAVFAGAVILLTRLASFLAGRRIMRAKLLESLKDDTFL